MNTPALKQFLLALFSLIIFFIFPFISRAQSVADSGLHTPGKFYYMVGWDAGPGSQDIYASANITVIKNNYVFTFKTSTETELKFFSDYNGNNYTNEQALLIGRRFNLYTFSNLSLSTGLSAVKIVRRDEASKTNDGRWMYHYDYIHKNTIGLPLEAKLWNNYFTKYLAFTITLSANINTERSFYGLGFGFQVGKTRDSKPDK